MDLLNIHADPPVLLIVGLLVLVGALFIRKEPEHSARPLKELVEQGHCPHLTRLLSARSDEHALKIAVGEVHNILLDHLADRQLVAAYVSCNLGVPPASITIEGLSDGSGELFSTES